MNLWTSVVSSPSRKTNGSEPEAEVELTRPEFGLSTVDAVLVVVVEVMVPALVAEVVVEIFERRALLTTPYDQNANDA
jgi:hypothetical protein